MGRTPGAVRGLRDRDALRVRPERPEGDPRPRRDYAARPGAPVRSDGSAPVAWRDGTGPVLLVPAGARLVELPDAGAGAVPVRRRHASRRRGERRSGVQRGPCGPRRLAETEGPLGGGTPPQEPFDRPQRIREEPLPLQVRPAGDRLRGPERILQLGELLLRREERVDRDADREQDERDPDQPWRDEP